MLKVILLSVKVLREQGATWVYLLAGEQDVMSSTSDPSSSSMDTFRQRLRQTESSEESIEPLSLCDDIYCDISEEISFQPDSPWTDFWRKLGRGDSRKKSKLKKGGRGVFLWSKKGGLRVFSGPKFRPGYLVNFGRSLKLTSSYLAPTPSLKSSCLIVSE